MRPIAVAAILVGATLCATGFLVIPMAINGYQYHRVDLLSSRILHISPLWADAASGVWLEPQNVTIQRMDPVDFQGQPYRVLNLSPLPTPSRVLGDWVEGIIDINVTGGPVNVYLADEANLTMWEKGEWSWLQLAWDSVLGHQYIGWGFLREELVPAMFVALEASNATPHDILVSLSLTASWTPRTETPDAALAAAPTPTLAEAARDVRLEGHVSSVNGTLFDFIVLERTSWEDWTQGRRGSSLFEANGSTSYRFIVPLEPSVVQGQSWSFVARNPGYSNLNVDVNVSSDLVWWEPPFATARPFLQTLGVVLGLTGVAVAAAGVVLELSPPRVWRRDDQPRSSGR